MAAQQRVTAEYWDKLRLQIQPKTWNTRPKDCDTFLNKDSIFEIKGSEFIDTVLLRFGGTHLKILHWIWTRFIFNLDSNKMVINICA